MEYEKLLKSTVQFFREMAEKSKAEGKNDLSFGDGISSGRFIGFSIAADHLESLFELEEKCNDKQSQNK